jgi:uncharacterized protein (DUF1778 family)
MATANKPATKTTTINIRTNEHDLAIIDQAAAALGKSRTEFMLESSRHEAEDVLLSRTFFVADDAAYERFVELLDSSTTSTGALRNLLHTSAPWE